MTVPTTTNQPCFPGDVYVYVSSLHAFRGSHCLPRIAVLSLNEKGVKFRREHPDEVPRPEDERVLLHEIGDSLTVDIRPATPDWLSFRAGGRIDKNGRANFSLRRSEVEDLIETLKGWVMPTL